MQYSFRIDAPGLENTTFLFERTSLNACGDLETAFLDNAGSLTRHRSAAFGDLAGALANVPGTEVLAISRNPDLVLDHGLPSRIAAALEMLTPLAGRWSLAAAGGLTPTGGRTCALYSSETPFIPIHTNPQPLLDALPDLYLVNAAWLRDLLTRHRSLPDTGFESALINQGYLEVQVALFAPQLTAGVDGAFRPRDPVKLQKDLQGWFAGTLAGEDIQTLMGPVTIEPESSVAMVTRPTATHPPSLTLAEAVDMVIEGHCAPLSLSIVTRTGFTRPHLLERLLTSITRARRDGADIEVVLSSDASPETCETALADLKLKFIDLTLRLQMNPPEGHSRVTNLLGGLRAATGTHVVVVDDDDYVDLFAFEELQRALFLGAAPLMITSSTVHDEEWVETPSGRHILARSIERKTYPAEGWRQMFGGVNCLPVCAMVMPRAQLIARLDSFAFNHDLSEDYTLFLLLLTDPALPEIVELPGTFGHISVRSDDRHSITMEDRRPWVRDIALYLADLTRAATISGPGQWALLSQCAANRDSAAAALDAKTISELRAALAQRTRQIHLMRYENTRLRALGSTGNAPPSAPASDHSADEPTIARQAIAGPRQFAKEPA
jgi:glycosyl transferase family 2